MGEYLPQGIDADQIERAYNTINQSCRGCTVEEFMVIIDQLFEFARTFEVKDFDEAKIENATRIYRRALIDLPPDLLKQGIDTVISNHKYGARLPLPAEIRKAVGESLAARTNTRNRLKMARDLGKQEPRGKYQPTEEEKQRVADILAETKRKLLSDDAPEA